MLVSTGEAASLKSKKPRIEANKVDMKKIIVISHEEIRQHLRDWFESVAGFPGLLFAALGRRSFPS